MQHVLITHNILRWAVVIFGALTFISGLTGLLKKRGYTSADNKVNLFFMITCDLQLVLGLVLYFGGSWFTNLKTNTAEVMKNPTLRFFSVEHFITMILAWLLVHFGRVAVKKAATDTAKHQKTFWFLGVAFILIMAMIPWPFRANIGRALLPNF
jgi:hypothetical protein